MIRVRWRLAFEEWVATWVVAGSEEVEFPICADPAGEWQLGMPLDSTSKVRIPVKGGKVDLSPLASVDSSVVHRTLDALSPIPDITSVPLVELCLKLEKAGAKATWLARQIASCMTASAEGKLLHQRDALENKLPEGAGDDEPPDLVDPDADESDGDDFVEGLFEMKKTRASRLRREKKQGKMKMVFNTCFSFLKTVMMYFLTARLVPD